MYESFYHLQKLPFSLTPDPQFFFPSAAHSRGLANLQYALNHGEGFVVIVGSPGTGKTELILKFMGCLPRDDGVLAKIVTPKVNDDNFLNLVTASFLPSSDKTSKGTLLKCLEEFFYTQSKIGRPLMLLIDEAHHLPISALVELAMLCNFQVDGKPVLQCVLTGQYPLEHKLNHPQLSLLKERVINSMHLESFGRQETQEYIVHRLGVASNMDMKNCPRFTDRAFSAIHHYAEGLPRRINEFCHRILLEACLEEKYDIDFKLVNKVIREIQEETLANTHNTMDLDFARVKSKPALKISAGQDAPSQSNTKAGILFPPDSQTNNLVNFSVASQIMPNVADNPPPSPRYNSNALASSDDNVAVTERESIHRRIPEFVVSSDEQNSAVDLGDEQTDKPHWAAPTVSGNRLNDNEIVTQTNKPVTTPTHHSKKDTKTAVSTVKTVNAGAKKHTGTPGKSVYQLATEKRQSGMLDKELLTLASWYQPQTTATTPDQSAGTQSAAPRASRHDRPVMETSRSRLDMNLNENHLPTVNMENESQIGGIPWNDIPAVSQQWLEKIYKRLPLSPLGVAISLLVLSILWWFTYGPGTSETLRWLNMVANMVTA